MHMRKKNHVCMYAYISTMFIILITCYPVSLYLVIYTHAYIHAFYNSLEMTFILAFYFILPFSRPSLF